MVHQSADGDTEVGTLIMVAPHDTHPAAGRGKAEQGRAGSGY